MFAGRLIHRRASRRSFVTSRPPPSPTCMRYVQTDVMVLHSSREELPALEMLPKDEFNVHFATSSNSLASLNEHNPSCVLSIKGPHVHHDHLDVLTHPSVRWIHVGGSGYDHFHQPWPEEFGGIITNGAGVLAPYLAETIVGALIALNGNFLAYEEDRRNRRWNQRCFPSLSGQTLLVVGAGHVGTRLAQRAKSFGMNVAGVARRRPNAERAAHYDSFHTPQELPKLLPMADVVSVHLRMTDETRHTCSEEFFGNMKPGSLFVNTSRGNVVDEGAFMRAMESGKLRGAYLDVFSQEPLPATSRLWTIPNVLMTPHISDSVIGWRNLFAQQFVQLARSWKSDKPLSNVVHDNRSVD